MPAQPAGERGRRSIADAGTALHRRGRSWAQGPDGFHAAGRMRSRAGGGFALRETGIETVGNSAELVREGLRWATGILLKMMERARGRRLDHLC